MKALAISDKSCLERFITLQALYNLVQRDLEYELIPLCLEEGLGIMTWSPLAGGFLTGKYRRDKPRPQNARLARKEDQSPFNEEMGYELLGEMEKIAKEHNSSIPQVALRYLLQKPGVTSIVVGARNQQQLEDNLGAASWELTKREMQILDKISAPPQIYPYWFIDSARKNRHRLN